MTPNDALTQLQRSHAHTRNRKTSPQHSPSPSPPSPTPSFRRRLTRSPSPSISLGVARKPSFSASEDPMPPSKISSNSTQATFSSQSHRSHRLSSPNGHANGHANGIPLVPEEDEALSTTPPQDTILPSKRRTVDYEIPRKTLHASIGFLALALWSTSCPVEPIIRIGTASLVVISSAELLRFNNAWFERLYERLLGFLMRAEEKSRINGVVWYLVGVLFSLQVYPLDIALVSILILSWADTTASTIGRMWGYLTPPLPTTQLYIPLPYLRDFRLGFAKRKSTAGFIAAALTGLTVTTSFWGYFASLRNEPSSLVGGGWKLVGVGIISGIISGIVEAIDFGRVDDNLTLPVLSGAMIWAVLRLLQ